ncbi:hypothetical protein HCN44_010942 [Aphidius gifuensis]|uniref:Uncharacterized protein n=1 Tax=Aphidius gifuensis TaxID=684658 RepID=A0A835CVX9_APHGI|nr:hypothetical protein HCN44_010942 [Aphidius gifuensis]
MAKKINSLWEKKQSESSIIKSPTPTKKISSPSVKTQVINNISRPLFTLQFNKFDTSKKNDKYQIEISPESTMIEFDSKPEVEANESVNFKLFNKTINSIKKIIILLKLLTLLNNYWNKRDINKKFCYVIFVTRRFKTNVLYHILKDIKDTNDKFNLLEPDYIVGYSKNPYKNSTESMCIAKSNKETLIRFR